MAVDRLKSWLRSGWDFIDTKVSSFAVAFLLILILGGVLLWGYNQATKANDLQNQVNVLTQTAHRNAENIAQVKANAAISDEAAKRVLKVVNGIPAADAIITAYVQDQNAFFAYFACVVQHGPPACGSIPPTPSLQLAQQQATASHPTTPMIAAPPPVHHANTSNPPATTTTTAPIGRGHGGGHRHSKNH